MIDTPLMLLSFVLASSFVMLICLLAGGRKSHVDERLADVSGHDAAGRHAAGPLSLPARPGLRAISHAESPVEQLATLRIRQETKKNDLHERMLQAGFYKRSSVGAFYVMRIALMAGPAVAGIVLARLGHLPLTYGLLIGIGAGIAGTLAPGLWLDHVKHHRQTKLRRALPDALDIIVICVEGGLSLSAAISRVARELAAAHPMLAVELKVAERQIQMGQSAGEAIREMARRFDLEELRSMASVIIQAERIGSGVAQAMEVFGDTLRQRRHQRAEEKAQQAAIKIIFPTLLFVFPGIFVVILGPAAIQIYKTMINGGLGGL